ncbi:helix-turn-helix domain-containing protein [Enterococcus faecium]|nr:helix-turn-helix transcriptional regulator [Enterococcus faecium]
MARKFNVTRQTISKWENNKTTPDIETLKKFVNFIVLT